MAHKSWFCFGDLVVGLGSAINGEGKDTQIATTVENRRLGEEDDGTITIGGEETAGAAPTDEEHDSVDWAHLDRSMESIGYVFPDSPTLRVVREENHSDEEGVDFMGIHGILPEENKIRYWAKFMLEHGMNPDSGAYTYAIIPGADPETTAEYASDPPFEVLDRSEAVHGVHHADRSMTAIQAFAEGTVEDPDIAVDGPASVMYQEGEEELTVAIADPTKDRDSIEVELPFSNLDSIEVAGELTVTETDPLTLVADTCSLDDLVAGTSLTARFAL